MRTIVDGLDGAAVEANPSIPGFLAHFAVGIGSGAPTLARSVVVVPLDNSWCGA
jgi:hypothetical protein